MAGNRVLRQHARHRLRRRDHHRRHASGKLYPDGVVRGQIALIVGRTALPHGCAQMLKMGKLCGIQQKLECQAQIRG